MMNIEALAERLDTAAVSVRAIPQLSKEVELQLDDAYRIQAASIERRVSRGDRRVGMKMGFTSRAKMLQMGVSDMIWGRLTMSMMIEEGGSISLADFIHPRVEPEVAFLMRKPLAGKVSSLEALHAVEAVACALEVIDSRYEAFKFSLSDVVADNASSSAFTVGPWRKPDTEIANLGMILSVNGRPADLWFHRNHFGASIARAGCGGACRRGCRRKAGTRLDRHGRLSHRSRYIVAGSAHQPRS